MITLEGAGICEGIAIGRLAFYKQPLNGVYYVEADDVEAEVSRLHQAMEDVSAELDEIYSKAVIEVGEEAASVFSVHQMLLKDPEYVGPIERVIRKEHMNAEYAIHKVTVKYRKLFRKMDSEYMRARMEDIESLQNYIWNHLKKGSTDYHQLEEPRILVSDILQASDVVRLDKKRVLGFLSVKGAAHSHVAILVRNMGIPSIFKLGNQLSEEYDGVLAIIDGTTGNLYIDPDQDFLDRMLRRKKLVEDKTKHDQPLEVEQSFTRDGKRIQIYVNIGVEADIDQAVMCGAEGIGLFRTEFLFLQSSRLPSEEEQFRVYKKAAQAMGSRPVIVRTIDLGADKMLPYLGIQREENPALGLRGIRFSLANPDIFITQLRALYRAALYGNIQIMYPMISSIDEIAQIKEIIARAKKSMDEEGVEYCHEVYQGIMIETPYAALMSRELAREVDFFSIGTNDLCQYTLAVDRQNDAMAYYYDDTDPAVLKLIEMTIQNAKESGIRVEICGEVAGNIKLTRRFIDMGVVGLSVSSALVPEIRQKIKEI